MSPRRTTPRLARRGFPRVSGDEPLVTIGTTTMPEFSPRERG